MDGSVDDREADVGHAQEAGSVRRAGQFAADQLNNLIKRIKRIGYGFTNFDNYRIRALLYAGKAKWRVLGSIVVR